MKLVVDVTRDELLTIAKVITIQRKELSDDYDRMQKLIDSHIDAELDLTDLVKSTKRGAVRLMTLAIKSLLDFEEEEDDEEMVDLDSYADEE